ncbi:MAG: iron ABC transporter permease [Candidatus Methanomethylophilaceae archaeon]|nr:iron ABC transporter permease [Candidatus Methanomethylophilaceae archaeon]
MEQYRRSTRRNILKIVILAVAVSVAVVVTLTLDLGSMTLEEVLHVLIDKDDPANKRSHVILVWELYMPRMAAGVLAGFGLGAAGVVMQCVLRNPLGSPYTLGISNAAAFGASLGIVIGGGAIIGQSAPTIIINNPYLVTICAFISAMIGTVIIIALVKVTRVSPETMVLAGVALSSIFAAGISALQYIYNDYALSTIVFWQFGSLGKPTWDELRLIAIVVLVICLYFFWRRWDLNALDNGADVARSLGVNVNRTRIVMLVLSAMMTATIVSFMGIIAFIGLLGPHMIRLLIGNDHRFLLPGSMLLGAIILLVADCIGQSAFEFTLPVGIITSFLGGPLFLFLLIHGYRKKGAML